MADPMVEKTQLWLNETYEGKAGYTPIPVTGNTGWTTIYALLHAFQIELGITATADNFGAGTISAFKNRFKGGIEEQEYPSTYEDNIYGIIQGCLWCKGYSTGADSITKHFYSGTGNAIKKLKKDAGIDDTNSTISLNIMKALMSMDQFQLVRGGSSRIRVVQQRLNKEYEEYIGLCPCDGLYGRQMNKALIKVLQAIEGFSVDEATGNFGDGTKSRLPILPDKINELETTTVQKFIDLIKYALICNGYSANVEFGNYEWNSKIVSVIKEFQNEMAIQETGKADVNTWMALLLSRGNPERSCVACDTIYDLLSSTRRKFLKDNGYEIIGRYINGTSAVKELEPGELKVILDAGFKYFPIYQRNGTPSVDKFTEEMAREDAFEASKGIVRNGVPDGAIVYFAVDFDAQDSDIANYIIPYFRIIANEFDGGCKIGIYGTRNVCEQVMNDNPRVVTCFVSDMSTGYSGNMGFKMPENWNLDQFYELKYRQPEDERINVNYPVDFDLDRVAYSGKYPVESTCDLYETPEKTNMENKNTIKWFNDSCVKMIEKYAVKYIKEVKNKDINEPRDVALLVLNALRYFKYNSAEWKVVLGLIDEDFIDYFIKKYEEEENKSFEELKKYLSFDKEEYLLIGENDTAVDFAHLIATTQSYLTTSLVPKFWTGWGGDLATAMEQVKKRRNESLTLDELAYEVVCSGVKGGNGEYSAFNYADTCSDADAIKIAELIDNSTNNINPVSDAIEEYYSKYSANRYEYYVKDIFPTRVARYDIYAAIYYKMTQIYLDGINVILLKGDSAPDDVVRSCCKAFANYIMTKL